MSKNETLFLPIAYLSILITSLQGEMTIGLLTSIESNAKQTLLTENRNIVCEPFGIIPLEKMLINAFNPEECKKAIELYYQSHPHDRLFAKEYLYLQQSYHYEKKEKGCILYANGGESLSEILLRKGLALREPKLDDIEWNGRLKRATKGAETTKSGLHDTLIQKFCIKEEK